MQDEHEKTQPGLTPRPAPQPVPARYVGLWQRLILQLDRVPADVTSNVFWLQTRTWHASIRIPPARPDFSGARTLADCSREQLLWLARQSGCAGITEIEGDVCTRLRRMDFQPPGRARDIGKMVFIEDDMIVETGAESRYLEIWERVPGSDGLSVALERVHGHDQAADAPECVVVAGEYMIRVRGRKDELVLPAPSLLELVEDEQCDDERLRALVDFEISFARQTPAGWRTQLSTLPFLEGQPIVASESLPRPTADGLVTLSGARPSRWLVHEWIED